MKINLRTIQKINLINMLLQGDGACFDQLILDDDGRPMSAADSLHTMIMEYARVVNGGKSDIVATSSLVTNAACQQQRCGGGHG